MRAVAIALTVVVLGMSPARAQDMAATDVQLWMAFFDKLVDTVVAAGSACDKLAAGVSRVIDSNKPAVDVVRNARTRGTKLPAAAQQRMVVGIKKMIPSIQRCGDRANVRAAFAKLDLTQP